MSSNRNYPCICCKFPTREISQITNKCDECDVVYFGDPRFAMNECERYIDNYMIRWNQDGKDAEPITSIWKDKYFELAKQWYPDIIKILDGWKLFDIRTKEQLEKLLMLL